MPWSEAIPGSDQRLPCYKSVTEAEARELQQAGLLVICDLRARQDG